MMITLQCFSNSWYITNWFGNKFLKDFCALVRWDWWKYYWCIFNQLKQGPLDHLRETNCSPVHSTLCLLQKCQILRQFILNLYTCFSEMRYSQFILNLNIFLIDSHFVGVYILLRNNLKNYCKSLSGQLLLFVKIVDAYSQYADY